MMRKARYLHKVSKRYARSPLVRGADIVLCRNVLIYMRDKDKVTIHEVLKEAVAPKGVILLGGADVMRTGRGFKVEWMGNYQFYFRDILR